MTIYLHYITHQKDNTRMKKQAFMKICAMFDWKVLAIFAFFAKEGWKFDNDYGFTFPEVVEHMHHCFDHELANQNQGLNNALNGYDQACEGRR